MSQVEVGPNEVQSLGIEADFTWTPSPVSLKTQSYECAVPFVRIALKAKQKIASLKTSGTFKPRPPKDFSF